MTRVGQDELARLGLEIRRLTLERLQTLALTRITLDFDGVVQGTTGHAEGTAVGFNKRKKGSRSYYPLFCTVAQTSQFLAMHHRPGNVHDSNGALAFMRECVTAAQCCCPATRIEVRMDSAFFTAPIVDMLHEYKVVVSNAMAEGVADVLWRHNGRGQQERIFGHALEKCERVVHTHRLARAQPGA